MSSPQRRGSMQMLGDADLVGKWLAACKENDMEGCKRILAIPTNSQKKGYLIASGSIGTGHTAMHWFASKGNLKAMEWLVSQGSEISHRNNVGSTPLHVAAGKGEMECVQYLLEQGASVQETNTDGFTALDLAEKQHHEFVAQFLEDFIDNGEVLVPKGASQPRYGGTTPPKPKPAPVFQPDPEPVRKPAPARARAPDPEPEEEEDAGAEIMEMWNTLQKKKNELAKLERKFNTLLTAALK